MDAPTQTRPLAYSTGDDAIDAAVRDVLATLPPMTPTDKSTVNAIFERARNR